MDLLTLLARNREGLTFSAICRELNWPKSSTHGLLATLQSRGFIMLEQNVYSVGIRTWEVGQAYLLGRDLATDALPYMRKLCEELNETVQLAVLDGRENVYIAKVDALQSLALASHVGARLPAHVTGLGKVLLSGLTDVELEHLFARAEFVKYTPATVGSLTELKRAVRDIRATGYGFDEGEYTSGVSCIAVPIVRENGSIAAAMSVSVPQVRFTEDLKQRILFALRQAATELSGRLGYQLVDSVG